jgi:hypothetical protein
MVRIRLPPAESHANHRFLGVWCAMAFMIGDPRVGHIFAAAIRWHPDSAGLGRRCYLPPRSNGFIGGRSFMIAHSLEVPGYHARPW